MPINIEHTFFATAPKGLEYLLAEELQSLGAVNVAEKRAGVAFEGELAIAYRACLWSRLANRILLPLATFSAADPDALYKGIQSISWHDHFKVTDTLAVDFSTSQSAISHTHYGAQKVKDAIVDQFRDRFGDRPSVQLDQPSIRVNIYLYKDIAIVSLDLSGDSLHRRGYRAIGGDAPLKENLAAAILLRAGWAEVAKQGGALVDLMCGSGTLPIEGALMAGDCAPGLLRDYFGFFGWKKHNKLLWQKLLDEAHQRRELGLKQLPPIIGYDADPMVVRLAHDNIEKANLHGYIHIEKRDLNQVVLSAEMQKHPGLVLANPPYGERLGEEDKLKYLYGSIGEKFKATFNGWQAAIFTGNQELGKCVGLRAQRLFTLYNGTIICKLLRFTVDKEWYTYSREKRPSSQNTITPVTESVTRTTGGEMFANRLRKNLKIIGQWAQRENISCYRLYDADLPDYALAIDRYEQWLHVQEYAPPKTIDPEKAHSRLQEALTICAEELRLPAQNIFLKVRRRQKGMNQYEKFADTQQFYTVHEGAAKFLVNLSDYVDTGLFLDHRLIRQRIFETAKGKQFLNLFAYTGSATVHAALGGAANTTTVDMSAVYLNWAQRNFALNGLSEYKHSFIQADCLVWIAEEQRRYDLIFLNPPTFSHSKRMETTLDIQRDHVDLIQKTVRLLTPDGVIIFATNKHQFKLDQHALAGLQLQEISHKTLPKDFVRSAADHYCWLVSLKKKPII